MADPYGYDRPTIVSLTDSINTFRRKVNQISDDLGDKRRLQTNANPWGHTPSFQLDSDVVGALIELDYRVKEADSDLYLRVDGSDLFIVNGKKGDFVHMQITYDSAAGSVELDFPNGDVTLDALGDIILDADGNDIVFKNGAGGDTVTHTLANNADYTITAPDDVIIDAVGDITLDADGNDIFFRDGASLRLQFNLGNNNNENWTGNLTRNINGLLIDSALTSIQRVAGTTITDTVGTNYALTAGGNYTVDVDGSIADSAGTSYSLVAGTTIAQTSGGTFTQTSGGNFATNVTGTYSADVSDDITLDAGGEQINFENNGNTRMVFNVDATPQLDVTGNYTVSGSGSIVQSATSTQELTGTDLTLDASNNIYLEADGDQIHLRAITANRYVFGVTSAPTLDISGNYTETGSGFHVTKSGTYMRDSAATNYTLTANNSITQTALTGSISQTSGNGFTQTAGGNFTTNVGGDFTVDAVGDITLDADGNDIIFKNGTGGDTVTHTLANDGNYTIVAPSNYIVDVTGDIYLDAADSDIFFRRSGTTFMRYRMGVADSDTTGIEVPQGDLFIDVAGDITLDADGGNVTIKDAGTTQFDFIAGTNKEIDVPSGNLTLDVAGAIDLDADDGNIRFTNAGTQYGQYRESNGNAVFVNKTGTDLLKFTDDDARFLGDVNIDGALTVAGIATLNGGPSAGTITLGDESIDTVNFGAKVNSNIIPATDGAFQLGDDDSRWMGIYSDSARIGNMKIISNTISNIVTSDFTLDITGDIILNADGGDILLKDAGTTFATFTNSSGNLIIKNGTTEALNFNSNLDARFSGNIYTDSALDTTNQNVAGAINELDSDMGDRTTLNTDDNTNLVSAINENNRRLIDIYDSAGVLLNP